MKTASLRLSLAGVLAAVALAPCAAQQQAAPDVETTAKQLSAMLKTWEPASIEHLHQDLGTSASSSPRGTGDVDSFAVAVEKGQAKVTVKKIFRGPRESGDGLFAPNGWWADGLFWWYETNKVSTIDNTELDKASLRIVPDLQGGYSIVDRAKLAAAGGVIKSDADFKQIVVSREVFFRALAVAARDVDAKNHLDRANKAVGSAADLNGSGLVFSGY